MSRTSLPPAVCPNPLCACFGRHRRGNVRQHSFYTTSRGRRRRYLCSCCKKTFCSTAGTPYYRLHKSRKCFDQVATMTVNGVSKSAIARILSLAWNTVARWFELAAKYAARFNHRMIHDVQLSELQADEITAFVSNQRNQQWLFASLDVCSRLWVSPRPELGPKAVWREDVPMIT